MSIHYPQASYDYPHLRHRAIAGSINQGTPGEVRTMRLASAALGRIVFYPNQKLGQQGHVQHPTHLYLGELGGRQTSPLQHWLYPEQSKRITKRPFTVGSPAYRSLSSTEGSSSHVFSCYLAISSASLARYLHRSYTCQCIIFAMAEFSPGAVARSVIYWLRFRIPLINSLAAAAVERVLIPFVTFLALY
jgi:hypothetical protein